MASSKSDSFSDLLKSWKASFNSPFLFYNAFDFAFAIFLDSINNFSSSEGIP
jgi:hypothetical protein